MERTPPLRATELLPTGVGVRVTRLRTNVLGGGRRRGFEGVLMCDLRVGRSLRMLRPNRSFLHTTPIVRAMGSADGDGVVVETAHSAYRVEPIAVVPRGCELRRPGGHMRLG